TRPVLLADGGRTILTDEDALEVHRADPDSSLSDVLTDKGTTRQTNAGNLVTDAAEALRQVLQSIKRSQPPLAETALGYPAYLDDTAATEAARAAALAGWRVRVAVPSALAWWAAARALPDLPGNRPTKRRRWWLVAEADHHGIHLTGIRVEGDHGVVAVRRTLRQLGGRAWFNRIQAGVADAVIRRCRRDPRALPETSQALAARIGEMAGQEMPYSAPVRVELYGNGWSCGFRPTGRDIKTWAVPLVLQLAREAEGWRPRLEELGDPGGMVLTPGARLPAVEGWARDWCGRLGIPMALPPDHAACETLLLWLRATRLGSVAPGLWRQATAPKTAPPKPALAGAELPEELASTKRAGYFEDISDLNLQGFGPEMEG
ncbi:MAG: hypothetical protein ACKOS8_04915, partial [Gemmataceae bacterium]